MIPHTQVLQELIDITDRYLLDSSSDEITVEELVALTERLMAARHERFCILKQAPGAPSDQEAALMRQLLARDGRLQKTMRSVATRCKTRAGKIEGSRRRLNGYRASSRTRETFHIRG